MTLKHSQQNPDNLTFSQLDFLAKICPLQEDKEELMMKQDQDYSTKVSGYLGKFDLDLPYLKTCEIYSLTKRGKPSKKSSFKLPKQGMMLNGQLFQQKIWEPVILESESGSLPTPRANPAMSQNLNLPSIKNHQHPNLETVISQLPTPTNQTAGKGEFLKTLVTKDGKPARIGERAYNPKTGKHVQITLDRAIELLPTPTTMDHLPQRGIESMKKQAQIHRKGRTKLANLREAVNPQAVEMFNHFQKHQTLPTPTAAEHKATAKVWKNQSGNMLSSIARRGELSPPTGQDMFLNPAFVEEMMGYEVGWLV
jgi:hypothetical protein